MTRDKALERIRKLLTLSTNPASSPGEAANAAASAQAIMERFQIEQSMLTESGAFDTETEIDSMYDMEDVGICRDVPFETVGRMPTWKWELMWAVAEPNGCKPWRLYRRRDSVLCLIGRPSDAAVARYQYDYLKREIDRLARREKNGRRWANNFRMGAVYEIEKRLSTEQKLRFRQLLAAAGKGAALVRVENAIAKLEKRICETERWMDRTGNTYDYQTEFTASNSGYEAGQAAGRSMDLGSRSSRALSA